MTDPPAHVAAEHETVPPLFRSVASAAWPAAAVLALQMIVFPVPLGVSLQGLVLGLLNAMVVLGLVLVYRANRVINLAQASVGTFPAAMAGGIVLFGAPRLLVTGGLGLAAGLVVLLGAVTILRLRPAPAVAAALAAGAFCAVGLRVSDGLGWAGGCAVGVVVAVLSGIAVDAIVIRRLRTSPRLIVTVATIGLA